MKRKLLLPAILVLFGFLAVHAQTSMFGKGDKVLNIGVGIGSYTNSGYKVTLPPLSASFEVGISDFLDKGTLGIGGYLAVASYKQTGYTSDSYWNYNKTVFGVRGDLHYPLIEKLDTYGGLMLGYKAENWKWHGTGSSGSKSEGTGFAFSLFVGGRYYFTDKLAAMAELGVGICVLNLGVALKL